MALANAYYGNILGGSSAQISDEFSPETNYDVNEEGENYEKTIKNIAMVRSSSLSSSPSSTNSSGYNNFIHGSGATKNNHQSEEAHSLINFKNNYTNFVHGGGGATASFLNFEHNDQSTHGSLPKLSHQEDYAFWDDLNCVQSSSTSYGFINNNLKKSLQGGEARLRWANSETNGKNKEVQTQDLAGFNKRSITQGESTPILKKQCTTSATKKPKLTKSTPSKDPQSIAAKNRRERISERLKILQELVPNGSKVDLVTMLEKAIGYVKFLQLQVKVLAADEFWPAQGGKAPDLAQVKEALDVILSSQRETTSSLG